MNYQNHYNKLIQRAQTRTLIGYKESHHIVPKCVGGSDEQSNLVDLTPEEHYIAHQLLVKIHPNNSKILWAASAMTIARDYQQRSNNKRHGWLRRLIAEEMKKNNPAKSIEARRKNSEHRKLQIRTPESNAKRSATLKKRYQNDPSEILRLQRAGRNKKGKKHQK